MAQKKILKTTNQKLTTKTQRLNLEQNLKWMKQKIKKTTMWVLSIILAYFVVGLLIHHWIIPTKTTDHNSYFAPGTSFHSKLEGLSQTVVEIKDKNLITEITIQPGSTGPVTHLHENFDESFTVISGTPSVQYGSEVKKSQPNKPLLFQKTRHIALLIQQTRLLY